MYLILTHKEAEERNIQGGNEIGLKGTRGGSTFYRWEMIVMDNETALDVGNGNGLTSEELGQCVNDIDEQDNVVL